MNTCRYWCTYLHGKWKLLKHNAATPWCSMAHRPPMHGRTHPRTCPIWRESNGSTCLHFTTRACYHAKQLGSQADGHVTPRPSTTLRTLCTFSWQSHHTVPHVQAASMRPYGSVWRGTRWRVSPAYSYRPTRCGSAQICALGSRQVPSGPQKQGRLSHHLEHAIVKVSASLVPDVLKIPNQTVTFWHKFIQNTKLILIPNPCSSWQRVANGIKEGCKHINFSGLYLA